MEEYLSNISYLLAVFLFVGLIWPSIFLRKTKKHRRLKFIGYWLIAYVITIVIPVMIGIATESDEKTAKSYLMKHYGQEMVDAVVSVEDGVIPYSFDMLSFYAQFNEAAKGYDTWKTKYNMYEGLTESFRLEAKKEMDSYKKDVDELLPLKGSTDSLYLEPLIEFASNGTYADKGGLTRKILKVKIAYIGGFKYIGLVTNKDRGEIIDDTQDIISQINEMKYLN